ncbi:MAG: hypothetical protein MHMPM18_000146 [Marteilia pararefringens]
MTALESVESLLAEGEKKEEEETKVSLEELERFTRRLKSKKLLHFKDCKLNKCDEETIDSITMTMALKYLKNALDKAVIENIQDKPSKKRLKALENDRKLLVSNLFIVKASSHVTSPNSMQVPQSETNSDTKIGMPISNAANNAEKEPQEFILTKVDCRDTGRRGNYIRELSKERIESNILAFGHALKTNALKASSILSSDNNLIDNFNVAVVEAKNNLEAEVIKLHETLRIHNFLQCGDTYKLFISIGIFMIMLNVITLDSKMKLQKC